MGARQREPHIALSWVFGEWGENVGTMILTKDPACTCFQVMPRLPESKARKAGQVDRDREICTYWLLALEKPLDAVSRSLGWGDQRPLIAMFFLARPLLAICDIVQAGKEALKGPPLQIFLQFSQGWENENWQMSTTKSLLARIKLFNRWWYVPQQVDFVFPWTQVRCKIYPIILLVK